MSDIVRALTKLNDVVGNLEGSVGHLEASLSGEQRDMFAAPPANSNSSKLDKAAMNEKLDNAIEQIEAMLEEGERANG
ncbi:MAG: hypothetical protein CMH26_04795 [Micavibrio sp.]|nr:hypothetical protein [Micavibrio sp.]